MTSIDPRIWNVLVRQALANEADKRGIEPGQYAFNTQHNKMRYNDAEGEQITLSVNEILAQQNMSRGQKERGKPFATAPFNPKL